MEILSPGRPDDRPPTKVCRLLSFNESRIYSVFQSMWSVASENGNEETG